MRQTLRLLIALSLLFSISHTLSRAQDSDSDCVSGGYGFTNPHPNCCYFKVGDQELYTNKNDGEDNMGQADISSNTPVQFTLIGYDNNNPYYYKLFQGTQGDGHTISGPTPVNTQTETAQFTYSFQPVIQSIDSTTGQATFFDDQIRYKLGFISDIDNGSDDTKCSVTIYASQDPSATSAFCCPPLDANDDGVTDTPSYDSDHGKCKYEKKEARRAPDYTYREPQACYLEAVEEPDPNNPGKYITIKKWVIGHSYFTDICRQAGPLETACDDCKNQGGLWTGIGCIQYKEGIQTIVAQLITFAVSVAGGIAILLILYGAFKISTSTGDPQKVGEGKEIITAAISGLIFIILSVAILRFIGVEIIKIPDLI